TDDLPQLFWFDDAGRAEAAVIATDWGDRIALDPIVMPGSPGEWAGYVMERGLAHAAASGFGTIGLEVDRDDAVLRELLSGQGFEVQGDGMAEAWMAADVRPDVSPLCRGYRLATRLDTVDRPHHMVGRAGPDVAERLEQTSLYRRDLDLVVLDGDDRCAAYGLFWFDPATATGLVEPMRTEDDHQRRGLARHVLTAGVARLAEVGATRIKICFEPGNPASRTLYLSVGFEPVKQTVVLARRADTNLPSPGS
ncbi:MAG: GNAT family N-acetyltransferase, partial [Actinobacteria bacterium]|nr:GNAT family N-acetyltransferase [Actinomycetota bacterium]